MTKGDKLEVELQNGKTITVTVENEAECRSCGEPIVWCLTASGKKMPCDIPDIEDDERKPVISHFASCADSDHWRKRA